MKKVLILTTVALLTGSMVGCGCFRGLFRGAAYNPCQPAATYSMDSCSSCDSCQTGTSIAPGPEDYAPMTSP